MNIRFDGKVVFISGASTGEVMDINGGSWFA